MIKIMVFFSTLSLMLSSCSVLQKNKKEFIDGYHYQRKGGQKESVYIDVTESTINIYPTQFIHHSRSIDTSKPIRYLEMETDNEEKETFSFIKPSFDVDFLTMPLKLRPSQGSVPLQLNTDLNGALYFGYRQDKYAIHYIKNPRGKAERKINHFGFSMGVCTGIGNTFMSPTNTNEMLDQEYEGIIWSNGIAGIIAINNFTAGLSLGFDHLLDKNHKIWLYQHKPWVGLAFGLNLN